VILYGQVFDVTSFLESHPGGSVAILKVAGTDATEEFDPIHPPGTLDSLPSAALLGLLDSSTLPLPLPRKENQLTKPSQNDTPHNIDACLNLADLEALATSKISPRAWAYYFSASDDLVSKSLNNTVYNQILLRPRVFVDVTRCTLHTSLLQSTIPLSLPIYVSPAAQARLCHPDGEAGIARACARFGALQLISNNASLTPEQIVEASPETTFGFQLYVQQDRRKSEALLARLRRMPQIKLLVLTLDAAVPGKREHDERRNVASPSATNVGDDPTTRAETASGGVGKALFAGTAIDLTWTTTLAWLAKHSDLPLVLKGIQTHEDALIASRYAQVKAVILSNHGGRALDTAPPAVHTLLEIRKHCPEVPERVELWVDGGIKRGTDVAKALCLGAKAVGVGRAALWGLGAGGAPGVERMFEILKAETKTALRLLGVGRVEQLGPWHVSAPEVLRHADDQINTSRVERDLYRGPSALGGLSNGARL
jgi:isopentenyl diphosphate isomerase/L-lactate dehydrogenase-like FMN-dependent dehydrogenase